MGANEKQVGGRHYKTEYEHWDLVLNVSMGYLEGCSTKYVSRWRKKGGIADLHKAMHYLEKIIEIFPTRKRRLALIDSIEADKEAIRFAKVNALSESERDYIRLLSTYCHMVDLAEAKAILEDLIYEAEHRPEKLIEINYPGTPEDGGEHSRMEIEDE